MQLHELVENSDDAYTLLRRYIQLHHADMVEQHGVHAVKKAMLKVASWYANTHVDLSNIRELVDQVKTVLDPNPALGEAQGYHVKAHSVYGKVLAHNGKTVVADPATAEKLADQYNGSMIKAMDGKRYIIKLSEAPPSLAKEGLVREPFKNPVAVLKHCLDKMTNCSYDRIDTVMKRIANRQNFSADQLHKMWMDQHGISPDDYCKGKNKLDENYGEWFDAVSGPGVPEKKIWLDLGAKRNMLKQLVDMIKERQYKEAKDQIAWLLSKGCIWPEVQVLKNNLDMIRVMKEADDADVEEGWKSAAAAAAMMGAVALGGGQAKADDLSKNTANVKAPVQATQTMQQPDGGTYPTNAPVGTKFGSFKDASGRTINKYVDQDLTTRFVPADQGDWKPQTYPTNAPVGTKFGSFVDKDGVKWDKYVGQDLTTDFKRATNEEDVWDKPNPVKKHKKLSAADKAAAKARAKRAGRKYPNMVDNIWAAKR